MPRQSITLTKQNDEWLKNHVEDIQDYANKSELINDLIRRARRAEAINIKLMAAEQSLAQHGPVNQTADEMLAEFQAQIKKSN